MKKEIAIVLDTMRVGGVEKALIEMLKLFDYNKYQVTLFLENGEGALQHMIPDAVNVVFYGSDETAAYLRQSARNMRFIEVGKGIINRILARINVSQYDLNAYYCAKCLPQCSQKEYDCVIAYQVLSPTVVSTALYRLRGKKKVLYVHGRNVRSAEVVPFFDRVYNKFDKVFCVSEKTRSDFSCEFPRTAGKTEVMYNLLDNDQILQKAEESCEIRCEGKSIVTVGRLVPVKGQQMVPETVRLLLDAGYKIC